MPSVLHQTCRADDGEGRHERVKGREGERERGCHFLCLPLSQLKCSMNGLVMIMYSPLFGQFGWMLNCR